MTMSSITRILTVTVVFSSLLLIVSATARPLAKNPIPIMTLNPISKSNNHSDTEPGVLAREFLNAHNKIRAAKGEPPLKWDKVLVKYAKRWAAKRINDCQMIHSYGPYGENLFWGGRDHWTPTQVVESWISEKEFYNEKTNKCQQGEMCGHYTQIVWRNTQRVGCCRKKCNNGGWYIVCSYDPPGNYVDESPFGTSQ